MNIIIIKRSFFFFSLEITLVGINVSTLYRSSVPVSVTWYRYWIDSYWTVFLNSSIHKMKADISSKQKHGQLLFYCILKFLCLIHVLLSSNDILRLRLVTRNRNNFINNFIPFSRWLRNNKTCSIHRIVGWLLGWEALPWGWYVTWYNITFCCVITRFLLPVGSLNLSIRD